MQASQVRPEVGKLVRDFAAAHPQAQSWSLRLEPWVEGTDTSTEVRRRYHFKVTFKESGKDGGYDVRIRPQEDADPEVVVGQERTRRSRSL